MSDHDNVDEFFEELKDIINNDEENNNEKDELTSYYNPKVEMYNEENDLHVVFHDLSSDEIENIKDIIRAFKGISNEYSEYFNQTFDENDYDDMDDTIGSQNIIPEGRYKGCTIQDAYNYHGHYSLSKLMQTVLRMKSKSKDYLKALYIETVQFALPRMQMKEISLIDFIKAYDPFIRKAFNIEKIKSSVSTLTNEEKELLYDNIINNLTDRMKKSIEK